MLFTGEYPEGIRSFLVSAYRYTLRVEAYVGFLTDRSRAGSRRAANCTPAPPDRCAPAAAAPVSVSTTAWLVLGAVALAGAFLASAAHAVAPDR